MHKYVSGINPINTWNGFISRSRIAKINNATILPQTNPIITKSIILIFILLCDMLLPHGGDRDIIQNNYKRYSTHTKKGKKNNANSKHFTLLTMFSRLMLVISYIHGRNVVIVFGLYANGNLLKGLTFLTIVSAPFS